MSFGASENCCFYGDLIVRSSLQWTTYCIRFRMRGSGHSSNARYTIYLVLSSRLVFRMLGVTAIEPD